LSREIHKTQVLCVSTILLKGKYLKTILVVGGAGYIGSYMVKLLQASKQYQIVVLDDLSTGHREMISGETFIEGDLADRELLKTVFTRYHIDAVMHFASFIQVGESVQHPDKYYRNNVVNTLNLLDVMMEHQVKFFIFSSTAALFGNPQYTPVDDQHPLQPINPYGRSKLMVEQILEDYDHAYGLKSVCLRYFNAAGADPSGEMGEWHVPETHLIPLVLQVASGRQAHVMVYGTDYETPDGTCVRDYIHIHDLCTAHQLALEKLMLEKQSQKYNLGNGQGFSVRQVVDAAKKVTNKPITIKVGQRRAGDPAVLVADSKRAKRELNWKPVYSDLKTIIQHAWQWEKNSLSSPRR
jgi:UDP-glucose 4-epimerase